jgi:hypothetical protein
LAKKKTTIKEVSEENVSEDSNFEADDKDIGDEGTSDVFSFMEDKKSCNTPSMIKFPEPSRNPQS